MIKSVTFGMMTLNKTHCFLKLFGENSIIVALKTQIEKCVHIYTKCNTSDVFLHCFDSIIIFKVLMLFLIIAKHRTLIQF